MIEIKFRAWDKENNVMYYSCECCLSHFWNVVNTIPDPIIMQYTGLKDKNGKEIYEGDIVEPLENCSWIGWCNSCAGWQPKYMFEGEQCHNCDGDYGLSDLDEMEIIGNIYENPELITNS